MDHLFHSLDQKSLSGRYKCNHRWQDLDDSDHHFDMDSECMDHEFHSFGQYNRTDSCMNMYPNHMDYMYRHSSTDSVHKHV